MRCVLDTNILVSAFLWQGLPGKLLDLAAEKAIDLYTSQTLIDELADVLPRKHLAKKVLLTGLTVEQMMDEYQKLATRVIAKPLTRSVSRDIDDDAILACALAADASLIVTGDDDLLVLKRYRRIPIVSPADALRRIDAAQA
jgi:uncharacterized protein